MLPYKMDAIKGFIILIMQKKKKFPLGPNRKTFLLTLRYEYIFLRWLLLKCFVCRQNNLIIEKSNNALFIGR